MMNCFYVEARLAAGERAEEAAAEDEPEILGHLVVVRLMYQLSV